MLATGASQKVKHLNYSFRYRLSFIAHYYNFLINYENTRVDSGIKHHIYIIIKD